jgi:DNA-directed RNA polymerase specialized sigma24 family protein
MKKRIVTLEDVWQYYDKLVGQALRKCFDENKAKDAVVEVFEKISNGQIDLSKVKSPYTYLVRCVQNQAFDNQRKLKAKKRISDVQNTVLVGGSEKLESMAADTIFKKKHGLLRKRPQESTYEGGDIDFGWHIKQTGKK